MPAAGTRHHNPWSAWPAPHPRPSNQARSKSSPSVGRWTNSCAAPWSTSPATATTTTPGPPTSTIAPAPATTTTPTPCGSWPEHGSTSSGNAGKTASPTTPPNTTPYNESSPRRLDTGLLLPLDVRVLLPRVVRSKRWNVNDGNHRVCRMELVSPRKAKTGDKVAVVSASFAAPADAPAVHEQAMNRVRAVTGLIPVQFPTTRKLDASPRQRADDLNAAFADPEIRAVIATIGGDDQVTVIPHLDAGLLADDPKPFLGYSDNTNLLNWLWTNGLAGYYGG